MIYTEVASLTNFSRVFYRTRCLKIRLKIINGSCAALTVQH